MKDNVLRFFTQNLGLTGFDDKNALFTICKELLENSIDACKLNSSGSHNIFLSLKKNQDIIQVECFDDGSGINSDSIESIGQIFNSSKAHQESSGTFGLGLKTILIFSHNSLNSCLLIIMRTSQFSVIKYNVALCEELDQPFVCNLSTQDLPLCDWPYNTGVITEFSCPVPSDLLNSLFAYSNIVHFHYPEINFSFDIFGTSFSFSNPSPSLSSLLREVDLYSTSSLTDNIGDKKVFVSSFLGKHSQKFKDFGNLYLLRSINGIPLPQTSSSSCVIFNTMRNLLKTDFREFGLKSSGRISKHLLEEMDVCVTTPPDILKHRPYLRTIPIRTPPDSTWNLLFISINLVSKKFEFGDIKKTHIKDDIGSLIRDNVLKSLFAIKGDLEDRGLNLELESFASSEKRLILYYLNHLSNAVSEIISSSSPETLKSATSILKLPKGATKEEIESKIKEIILSKTGA